MRIIAIPLTRPRANVARAGLNRLTYYQFQISGKGKQKSTSEKGDMDDKNSQQKKGLLPEEGVMNWVTNKAADIWAGFGKAKGGWKVCLFPGSGNLGVLVDLCGFFFFLVKTVEDVPVWRKVSG